MKSAFSTHSVWRLFTRLFLIAGLVGPVSAQSSVGQLQVTILDADTRQPTPLRVRLTRNGKPVTQLPTEAVGVMYGLWNHEDGYGFQPDSSFYVGRSFRLALPPGTYQLTLSKGHEYVRQQITLTVKPGQIFRQTYRLNRWVNMAVGG